MSNRDGRALLSQRAATHTSMRKAQGPHFRRSPFLVCYWDAEGLVFENYATRKRTSAAPLTCAILDFFGGWRSFRALTLQLPEYSVASLRKACAELTRRSLLQRSGDKE